MTGRFERDRVVFRDGYGITHPCKQQVSQARAIDVNPGRSLNARHPGI